MAKNTEKTMVERNQCELSWEEITLEKKSKDGGQQNWKEEIYKVQK